MLAAIREDFYECKAILEKGSQAQIKVNVEDSEFFQEKCHALDTLEKYADVFEKLPYLSGPEYEAVARYLCRTDLFFLLVWGLNRSDAMHPWVMSRCKEVQENPDGYLDLWSREHYKSTIITFALTIQDILASHGDEPLSRWDGLEPVIGIFSCTRPLAKGFLRQIKREFESNQRLRNLFTDIIWQNPQKEAPKWSEDDGIILKRKSNPKESTVEAWGTVDGQPTSKHFNICVYDDIVTIDNVRSPNMISKTTSSWELSLNLGAEPNCKRRYPGTRYHFNDTYRELMKRQAVKVRVYPATHDGTPTGKAVLWPQEVFEEKFRMMGPYTGSCQLLLNPIADEQQSLKREWLAYHDGSTGEQMNRYLLVDPANSKKTSADTTSMGIIGLNHDANKYLLDGIRDRLSLPERVTRLFELHRKWQPLKVGYESYGMQADIEYIKERQKAENYFFEIVPLGGKLSKEDRIRRMVPDLSQHRWRFPRSLMKTNYEGRLEDIMNSFIEEEYAAFPVCVHDDFLDMLSRIYETDLKVVWPNTQNKINVKSFINRGGVL